MNAHRANRTTTALPPCPSCRQSATGVYNKKLGCNRCQTLHPAPAVRAAVPAIVPAAPISTEQMERLRAAVGA